MSLDPSLKKKLAGMKSKWNSAKKKAGEMQEYVNLPDGFYVAKISQAKIEESSNGRPQIRWEYTVLEGDSKGESQPDWDGLDREESFVWLQRKLARLGKEVPEDPDELEAVLKEIVKEGARLRIRVKTKKKDDDEFTHVYVNKVLSGGGEETEEETEEEAEAEADADEAEAEEKSEKKSSKKKSKKDDDESEEEAEEEEDAEKEDDAEAEEEEAEEEESDDDAVSLEEGMEVEFTVDDKKYTGKILEFVDDDTKARVETSKGKKFKLKIEKLSPVASEEEEADEEESEDEPEDDDDKKSKKKSSAKAVKKSKK